MIFVGEAPALLEEAFFGAGLLSDLPADAVLVLGDRDPPVPLADLVLARSFSEESSEDLRLLDWSATALSLDGRDEVQHPRTARDPNRSCSAIWIFACRPNPSTRSYPGFDPARATDEFWRVSRYVFTGRGNGPHRTRLSGNLADEPLHRNREFPSGVAQKAQLSIRLCERGDSASV